MLFVTTEINESSCSETVFFFAVHNNSGINKKHKALHINIKGK